ncbi:MAG TPA: hypothetical protein VIK04_12760 [Solirubrobacteraceae bacterium]
MLVTEFRPEALYPQNVAGVAWIDHTRTSVWLYPGRLEPNVQMVSRGPMEIPPELRGRLVATFNSGFKPSCRTPAAASCPVGTRTRRSRTVWRQSCATATATWTCERWAGGPIAGPNIVYARQNLPLIVNNARLNPNPSDGPQWGATLGNAMRVWRSGIGIHPHGNLIYAAANDMTVGSLAGVLRPAGAVRAMELDINTHWTSFITYQAPARSEQPISSPQHGPLPAALPHSR